MFHHRNKKYSIRKVKNGVASVVIALLFATNSSPALAAVGDTYPSAGCFGSFFGGTKNDCEPLRGEQGELPGERGEAGPPAPPELGGRTQGPLKGEEGDRTLCRNHATKLHLHLLHVRDSLWIRWFFSLRIPFSTRFS
ncbi:YSIRK-type signal peptide-containing protein, partial [Streptococcus ruminantium]|uniref:YSIRK-type signal peptide-containing protein n=1 Tax=Streptococcus ruminantium TaxID=1917441 RepID=UPI00280D904B